MHQNHYFLRQLAPRLDGEIRGKYLLEAFSQERDELILVFAEGRGRVNFYKPFFIKASLRPELACLFFPEQFGRARRNSIDLFTGLYGKKAVHVRAFANERAMGIGLESGETLVFKLFGNRSNVVLFDADGVVCDVFNNKLAGDHSLVLSELDRGLDQSYEAFVAHNGAYEVLFPTFGKVVKKYLQPKLAAAGSLAERWEIIQETLSRLESPTYYLTELDHVPVLSLLRIGEVAEEFTDPLEALNRFYFAFARLGTLEKEKAAWLKVLGKRIKKTENYLSHSFEKLVALEEGVKNEERGHILMANLHAVPPRAERVELHDFYRDRPISIKLKKDLTPQKNAEEYYRKARNEKIEVDRIQENLKNRERERVLLIGHRDAVARMDALRDLRQYVKSNGLASSAQGGEPGPLFRQIDFQNFVILVGKNAKNNDLLTQQYAHKDDLWLHARDVTGSHVVVKHQAGKNFPAPVIERAAELAAWYSKRRTDSHCPVIVTPKKYVRKPKGLPPGAVVVEKEEVVMVEPRA